MKMITLVALALMLCSSGALAQDGYWKDMQGRPVPETPAMQAQKDFGGSVLVTMDHDWRDKWATPEHHAPVFTRASTVPYGKNVYLLTFFSNPKLDAEGAHQLRCDFRMTSPKGEVTLEQDGVDCFSGKLGGNPYNLRLSDAVITAKFEKEDPSGEWTFHVTLRDLNRGVTLPLMTSVMLK